MFPATQLRVHQSFLSTSSSGRQLKNFIYSEAKTLRQASRQRAK